MLVLIPFLVPDVGVIRTNIVPARMSIQPKKSSLTSPLLAMALIVFPTKLELLRPWYPPSVETLAG